MLAAVLFIQEIYTYCIYIQLYLYRRIPTTQYSVVGILVRNILFILVFLGFNKEQRQYALQNTKNFYISPYSVAVELC